MESKKSNNTILMISGLALILMIGIPFLLNQLIQIETKISIVGEPKDWLSFWSNYMGGTISSICAFVILYFTLKSSDEDNKNIINNHSAETTKLIKANDKSIKELISSNRFDINNLIRANNAIFYKETLLKDLDRFSNSIAERIGHLQYSKLRFIKTKINEKNVNYNPDDDIVYLKEFLEQVIYDRNTFCLIYTGEYKDFCDTYAKIYDILIQIIGETIDALEKKEFDKAVLLITDPFFNPEHGIKNLYKKACETIEKKKNEINDII